MKDKHLIQWRLIEYIVVAILTAGGGGYILVASIVALWIINPGLAVSAFALGFVIVMMGLAAAPRKKGSKR